MSSVSSYSYSANSYSYSGSSSESESEEAESVKSFQSYSELNAAALDDEVFSDTSSEDPRSLWYRMKHMFDKDMDDPLAHMSVRDKKLFMFGDRHEHLETSKHPTVKHREAIARASVFAQERQQRVTKRREEDKRYKRLEVMRVREEHRIKQEKIREMDRIRYANELRERDEKRNAEDKFLELQSGWNREIGERRDKAERQHQEWLATEEKRLAIEEKDRRRDAEAAAERSYLDAEAMQMQWAIEKMRQMGTIPAVDMGLVPVPEEQRETAMHVVLRVAPPRDEAELEPPSETELLAMTEKQRKKAMQKWRKKKNKKPPFFDVDLKRYRNVQTLKGERIGEKGGRELGKALQEQVCPRLHSIDLSWCLIRTRGCCALAGAFEAGFATGVHTLNLSGNDLSAIPMRSLLSAFKSGWNQLLYLDLRKNCLYDEGACVIAHMILEGGLPKIKRLLLQSNSIGDTGGMAICKAFTAANCTAPDVEEVNLRFNRMNTKCLRLFANSDWATHKFFQI